jgi:hypothetical protein
MDSASTRAFLNHMFTNKDVVLLGGFIAWQFGKSYPLQVSEGRNGLFDEVPLLPSNAPEIIRKKNAYHTQMLQQHFYCEVSKVAVISYPDGAEWLERIWNAFVHAVESDTLKTEREPPSRFNFEIRVVETADPFQFCFPKRLSIQASSAVSLPSCGCCLCRFSMELLLTVKWEYIFL